jgi:hypothetical protein
MKQKLTEEKVDYFKFFDETMGGVVDVIISIHSGMDRPGPYCIPLVGYAIPYYFSHFAYLQTNTGHIIAYPSPCFIDRSCDLVQEWALTRARMLYASEGDYVERGEAICSALHMLLDGVHAVYIYLSSD